MSTAEILKYAAIVAGYLLALARLNDKARPFWQFLPTWAQPVMPALVVIIPELALGLQKGTSVEDVLSAIVTAGGALMISLRGAVPAKHYEQLSPLAKSEIAAVRGKAPKDDGGPPTPRDGRPIPPSAAGLLVFLAALAGAPHLVGCSPAANPEARGAQAANLTKVGYAAAVVTLRGLSDLHLELAKAVQTPEEAKVAAPVLSKMLDGLDQARSLLAQAKPYVTSGKDEAAARRFLRAAVDQLDQLLPLLAQLNRVPPNEVLEALGYLRGFLGGAS
jgi:hypothetical protein